MHSIAQSTCKRREKKMIDSFVYKHVKYLESYCTNGYRWDVEQMHSRRQYLLLRRLFFLTRKKRKNLDESCIDE